MERRDSMARSGVLLVGSIPRPVGGVTQHVWRLAGMLANSGCDVLDLQPAPGKYPLVGCGIQIAPQARWRRFPWLLGRLYASRAEIIHFHFSFPTRFWWAGSLLTAASRGARCVVTFHHGDLAESYERLGAWRQQRLRAALRRFDCVVSLSESQRRFFEAVLDLPPRLIVSGTSYLPLSPALRDGVAETVPPSLPGGWPADDEVVCLASGYPAPSYRHEFAIRLVERLRRDRNARLILCLYGQAESEKYRAELLDRARTAGVDVLMDVDFAAFQQLLRRADLYLRPTAVDSFGLAVADAATADVAVVASDICERYPGTFLCPTDDYPAFEQICLKVLAGSVGGLRRSTAALRPWIERAYGWSETGM